MQPWLLVALFPLPALAGIDRTHGVSPTLLLKYTPTQDDKWTCLDGSKTIPWSYVNDDSCDCADGSDEPGTSACPNSSFYCQNKGHVGATIPSSRINDRICEPECCDGSDELAGVCKNTCEAVGAEYRKKRDALLKLQEAGSKIRASYIIYAQDEKKRLEDKLVSLGKEIQEKERRVAHLRDTAERSESISQAALEHKKQSPLFQSLIDHSDALKALKKEYEKEIAKQTALGNILDALRTGYNPNYQDMAVLEAVRGWEQTAGLPHINDIDKENAPVDTTKDVPGTEVVEEGWTIDELNNEIETLLAADHITLLMEHDEHINAPVETFPAGGISDKVSSWLEGFGLLKSRPDPAAESNAARQKVTEAESELRHILLEKAQTEIDVADILKPEKFGPEGEWKKLDGLCLEKDTGDYTYEVCLFKEAKQKAKSGSSFSLGRFSTWNPSSEVSLGGTDYYSKQTYKHGARCWNGPERNVILLLSCGTENRLVDITELEKCEYQFTVTTPALCLPLGNETVQRDEL